MVVKIIKAGAFESALQYNEKKVFGGTASIIDSAGIDSEEYSAIRECFRVYERANKRTKNTALHISINPAGGEELDDQSVSRLARELLEGLGYGDQPYLLYRHNDIDREHFHIVSIRVDKEGNKISDSFEHERCRDLCEVIGDKYGFVLGLDKDKKSKDKEHVAEATLRRAFIKFGDGYTLDQNDGDNADLGIDDDRENDSNHIDSPVMPMDNEEKSTREKVSMLRFYPRKSDVRAQIAMLFNKALEYNFESFNQFQCIMRSMGMNVVEKNDEAGTLLFQGLDKMGRACSVIVPEVNTGIDYSGALRKKMALNKCQTLDNWREKRYVSSVAAHYLRYASSPQHFDNLMRRRGLSLHLSYTKTTGELFGATLVDARTQSVFKCSELGKSFSLDMYKERLREWEENGVAESNAPVPRSSVRWSGKSASKTAAQALLKGGSSMLLVMLGLLSSGARMRRGKKRRYY